MNKLLIFFVLIGFQVRTIAQVQQFGQPLQGEYGKDFIIVNYPDWGIDSIVDHMCGSKTYTGHAGTDITLKSFPQMDTGVNVLAADSGVVTFIRDGEFDRQTISVPSRGFGNYIAIKHPNKMYSYYAHLKKNSIIVQPGDIVSMGQIIGQVGSSGNSTDPHLHFEVWYDSLYLVDPFSGPCGNANSLWIDSPSYDTSYHLWDFGLINYIPHIDSLRFRVGLKSEFIAQDSIITFWNLQHGIHKGDSSKLVWITPFGEKWFEFSTYYDRDWSYYYYYSYIPRPMLALAGEWNYQYYFNDSLVNEGSFTLKRTVSSDNIPIENISYQLTGKILEVELPSRHAIKNLYLYSALGQPLIEQKIAPSQNSITIDLSGIPYKGLCLLIIYVDNRKYSFKLVL